MPVEVIAIIISAASLLVTVGVGLFVGFAWMLRHMDERFVQADASVDARFAQADASVSARFDKVDERFTRMDDQFKKIDTQMSGLQAELNDVKVAVARLEGPRPRLIRPH